MAISKQVRTSGSGRVRYTFTVRRAKVPPISFTTGDETAGRRWAERVEDAIDRGAYKREDWIWTGDRRPSVPRAQEVAERLPSPSWTLFNALSLWHAELQTYGDQKAIESKGNRIKMWQKSEFGQTKLSDIKPDSLQRFIDGRLRGSKAAKPVSANTIRNDVFALSALFEFARTPKNAQGRGGWGLLDLENPTKALVLPRQPPARNRRLEVAHDDGEIGERERLRAALASGLDAETMVALFDLALETGMRQSELLDIRLGQVRRQQGQTVVHREDSKNGDQRRVTMSSRARTALEALITTLPDRSDKSAKLIRLNGDQLTYRWRLARKKAGITHRLTWHDLRHEGLSVMAEKGLTIGELKAQSGHKSTSILVNYINAIPRQIADKLG